MHEPLPPKISLADFLVWEQQQAQRHEWIDGTIVPCAGVTSDHSVITSNLNALFHAAVADTPCFVQTESRQLVPRNKSNRDLGSFYADVFVSCAPEDRAGSAAHFPTVIVEVLSEHVGEEFTRKKRAYLWSAQLADYIIIDSRNQYTYRFSWKTDTASKGRRLITCEQLRGPLAVPSLGLIIPFEQIYAKTGVPRILHSIDDVNENEMDVILD